LFITTQTAKKRDYDTASLFVNTPFTSALREGRPEKGRLAQTPKTREESPFKERGGSGKSARPLEETKRGEDFHWRRDEEIRRHLGKTKSPSRGGGGDPSAEGRSTSLRGGGVSKGVREGAPTNWEQGEKGDRASGKSKRKGGG